tara:strand:+ start:62 stop:571 length:510 start_codon:yes stop_codon:yes gene_type:complete
MTVDFKNYKFPCTKCGACCRSLNLNKIKANVPYLEVSLNMKIEVPPAKENGDCAHLTEDNQCAIYEERPDMCKISGKVSQALKEKSGCSDMEIHDLTIVLCNQLMDSYPDIDSSFLIKVEDPEHTLKNSKSAQKKINRWFKRALEKMTLIPKRRAPWRPRNKRKRKQDV